MDAVRRVEMDPAHDSLGDCRSEAASVPLPEPKPSLVTRCDYLWSRETAIGRQRREHPACRGLKITVSQNLELIAEALGD